MMVIPKMQSQKKTRNTRQLQIPEGKVEEFIPGF